MTCDGHGTYVPSTKRAHRDYRRWTTRELETVRGNPGMTAGELASLLPGRSEASIRHVRSRHGRYDDGSGSVCAVCGGRPIWVENRKARAMHLCKGCYLDEAARRLEEEREAARVRKMMQRRRDRDA